MLYPTELFIYVVLLLFSNDCSLIARLENAYLYVDAKRSLPLQPTDQNVVLYTLPDNPAVLPNSNKHIWGRMLALGSCSVKVCGKQLAL